MVLDAHDIPFDDSTFDAVVAEAVLEHVVDPYACAGEIWRVLKPRGVVYAETPSCSRSTVGDTTSRASRRSVIGVSSVVREVDSGVILGPGTSLAWSWTYFHRASAEARAPVPLRTRSAG